MKFCIYCGQKIDEYDVVCPNPECRQTLPGRVGMVAKARPKPEESLKVQKSNAKAARKAKRKKSYLFRKPDSCLGWIVKGFVWYMLLGMAASLITVLVDEYQDAMRDFSLSEVVGEYTDRSVPMSERKMTFYAPCRSRNLRVELDGVDGTVEWISSNPLVAKVEGNGQTAVVTSIAGGKAEIVARCDGKTSTCKVTCDFSDINTYEFVISDADWNTAYVECIHAGGRMVTINSEAEYKAIIEQIEEEGYGDIRFFVGASRAVEDDTYRWIDQTGNYIDAPMNGNDDIWCAEHWMRNEPTYVYKDTIENCVELHYEYEVDDWVFNDRSMELTESDSGKFGYIIEYERNGV